MNRLLRAAMRRAWRRGVLDGNQAWLVVGGAALLAHLFGRYGRRRDDIVFAERIAPGESFVVTHRAR